MQISATCGGKSLLDHPAQEAAIRAGRELVQRRAGVLAEAEHDRPRPPSAGGATGRPSSRGPARGSHTLAICLQSLIGELELRAACRRARGRSPRRRRSRSARPRTRRRRTAVRVLQAARLALLPQPERVDDLLAGEIERRAVDPRVLGLQHVDVERRCCSRRSRRRRRTPRRSRRRTAANGGQPARSSIEMPWTACAAGWIGTLGLIRQVRLVARRRRARAGRTARSPDPGEDRCRWSRSRTPRCRRQRRSRGRAGTPVRSARLGQVTCDP